MTTVSITAFEQATAVRSLAEGRFVADVDVAWSAPTGPNGGYLAAILIRALVAGADPEGVRRLRSLTVHYLRVAAAGPLELTVRTARTGRRMTTATVTASQAGREVLIGLATFAVPGLTPAGTWAPVLPAVAPPPPDGATAVPYADYQPDGGHWLALPDGLPKISSQLRMAPQTGGIPFSGRKLAPGEAADVSGWIGSPEPQSIDAAYVAQLTDFWWPPAFEALSAPAAIPTLDLTVHIRADLPPEGLAAQPVLGHYRSSAAQDGLVEEDARLFLADGTLLAQSRQLALLTPLDA